MWWVVNKRKMTNDIKRIFAMWIEGGVGISHAGVKVKHDIFLSGF